MKIIDVPLATLELLDLRLGEDIVWPEPEPISASLALVLPYDPDLLPEVLAKYVTDNADRMQSPPDFIAVSLITTLGSVIGAGCAVKPKEKDDWWELPNLWGGVIGGPSSMKSPSINAGCEALKWIESDAMAAYNAELAAFLLDQADRDYELKLLKSDKGAAKLKLTDDEARARIRELSSSKLVEPKRVRYQTNDATIEVLGQLLADNPHGIMLIRDELIGLLASCNRPGHEGDRPFYLEAWNGKNSFAIDRIGRGHIMVPRLCLSVFGGIQPSKLQDYIAGTLAGYDNDGLLQRFQLMVYPDQNPDWEYTDQTPDIEARDRVINIVRKLAGTDFVSLGATPDERDPPYFRFSPSAQKQFVKWMTDLEAKVRSTETPVLAEHLSKYRKLIPALALIFHLVDLAGGKQFRQPGISKEALMRAIRWGIYLESHAKRIYGLGIDFTVNAANAISTKIKTGQLQEGFSQRDIYKSEWSGLSDREVVAEACRELEESGWLRRTPAEKGAGRPASPSYAINPALKPS